MIRLTIPRNPRIKWVACTLLIFICTYIAISSVFKTQYKTVQSLIKKESGISSTSPVRLWIDLPNAFPMRHCLQEYNRLLTVLKCEEATETQIFFIHRIIHSDDIVGEVFQWKNIHGQCIIPGKAVHEDVIKETIVVSDSCDEGGFWTWTEEGQIQWSQGCKKCVASVKWNQPLAFTFCKPSAEEQDIEIGRYEEKEGARVLRPLDEDKWRIRQDNMRNELLTAGKVIASEAIEEIDMDDLIQAEGFKGGERRAAVFYVDQGQGAMANVNWWIYTWKFIGLNAAEEAFDLVMMIHPSAIENLPTECKEVTPEFHPNFGNAGECLYKPYVGISYRDKTFDAYMNSQECLFGPGSEFLSQFKLLLRADLDTFPTPRMLGYWPEGVIADKGYGTMMGLDSIKDSLRDIACSVGIEHRGWFNIGSSWYGDGRRVRNLAKLTVALQKYGRAKMFGPGTHCRCAECTSLPKDCEWGYGPYLGVLLLYLQEISINKILTPEEWDNLPAGYLDQGVTDGSKNVCGPALLHCMHNAEDFSKLAFGVGKYLDFDMAALDVTNIRDFATFMALTSNNQGKNGHLPLENWNKKIGNSSWSEFCKTYEETIKGS